MMTIAQSIELMHRTKTKIERSNRNQNVHEDIEIMDGLVSLVETLQESLRNSATVSFAAHKGE